MTDLDEENAEAEGQDGRARPTGRLSTRVGGRSERVVRDVLDATVRELGQVGYAKLRVEDVAARAGVNKTTVYRRWPTKADLVRDALHGLPDHEIPDTGALASDLLELLRRHVVRISTPEGRAVARMILMEIEDPQVQALARALREERVAQWIAVTERAVARGELPVGSEPELLVDLLMGVVMAKVRKNEEVDDRYLRRIVGLVVLGAQHGGAIRR